MDKQGHMDKNKPRVLPRACGLLPVGGGSGRADPGAMGLGGRDRQQAPLLDSGQLPASLMDQPMVAVAEQDQVCHYSLI